MSGTYPIDQASFTAINFKINTPTLMTNTMSGKVRRVGMGHSYYSFTVKHDNLTPAQYGKVVGFISQQYGPLEDFQIVLPELSYTKSTNQTATTVTVTGGTDTWTVGLTTYTGYKKGKDNVGVTGVGSGKELLLAGDFFKFANHTKVYMCSVSWTLGSHLYFSGPLTENVPNGTELTLTAIPFTVILESPMQEFDVGMGGMTQLQLDMREDW